MNLDEALTAQEKQVDELLKAANKYTGTLKAWKKACQVGHVGNLQKAGTLADELAATLAAPASEAHNAWDFDVRAYLESDAWWQELQAVAAERGLRILDENDTVVSSPVVIRAMPGRGALAIGKVSWPRLRPQVVVAELKRLRDRASSSNSQEFVESLFAAVNRLHTGEGTLYARFKDIYELFSITPGWKKENPPAAFGQAIYALHRSETRMTRAGRKFEMDYPSGNAKDKDAFIVISEDGRPIKYYGIHFR